MAWIPIQDTTGRLLTLFQGKVTYDKWPTTEQAVALSDEDAGEFDFDALEKAGEEVIYAPVESVNEDFLFVIPLGTAAVQGIPKFHEFTHEEAGSQWDHDTYDVTRSIRLELVAVVDLQVHCTYRIF